MSLTKEGYRKHKELIDAWASGAQIQFKCPLGFYIRGSMWCDTSYPQWEEEMEYRAKPENYFDAKTYLKALLGEIDPIEIGLRYTRFKSVGEPFLDFERKRKKYWLWHEYFERIEEETDLKRAEVRKLCTDILNEITGLDGELTNIRILFRRDRK